MTVVHVDLTKVANIVRCAIRLLPDDSLSKSRLGRLPKYITRALVIKRYRRS